MDVNFAHQMLRGTTTTNQPTVIEGGVLQDLQSTLTGTIPVVYPFAIGVAVLFAGYFVLKRAWHRRV